MNLTTTGPVNLTSGSSGVIFKRDGSTDLTKVQALSGSDTGLGVNTVHTYTARGVNADATATAESSSSAGVYTLQATPAAPTFTSVATTSFRVNTTGPANLTSGSSGVIFHNGTADRTKVTALYDDVTGLSPNTSYTFKAKGVNGDGAATAYSSTASQWTLSVAPVAGSVTPGTPVCVDNPVTWAAVGGFGAGTIQKYKYVWDQNATHTWTESETDWSSGTIQTTPTAAGAWYLHVKGYNGATPAVANGTYDYSVTANALPTAPGKGIIRFPGGGTTKIKIADVGASESITSLSDPPHGTASKDDTYIYYVPDASWDNGDSFTYTTAANSYGCSKTATITVTVTDQVGSATEIAYNAGGVTVTFAAIPSVSYDILHSGALNGIYTNVHTFTAPSAGVYSWTDNNPSNPGFYRLKYPGTTSISFH